MIKIKIFNGFVWYWILLKGSQKSELEEMLYRTEYTLNIANTADNYVASSKFRTEVFSSFIRFAFQVSLEQKHYHMHTVASSLKPRSVW